MLQRIKHLHKLKQQALGLEALLAYFPELRYQSIILDAHTRIRLSYNLKRYWFMKEIVKIT